MLNNRMWFSVALLLALGFLPCTAMAFDPDAPSTSAATPTLPVPIPAPGTADPALPGGVLPPINAPVPIANAKPVSLFLTLDELSRINDAIATYKRNRDAKVSSAENQAKNFLNQLDPGIIDAPAEKPKPVPFTYPQFFLQTLSYHSANEWLVVINGEKFIPHYNNPRSWLKVVMVDKEMVVMEWRPQNMKKVSEAWMVAPVVPAKSDVLVDSIHETVTFTLKPNQTFSSFAMRVVEGKVPPVTVMIQPDEQNGTGGEAAKPIDVPQPAEATPVKPTPPVDDTRAGVPGLNDTYKKIGLE